MPQPNAWDCGVFTMACATDITHDRDPVLSQWDSTHMRKHLESCVEQRYISPFPTVKKRRVRFGRRITKSIEEIIHCTCQMPNDKQSAIIFCCGCHTWYHGTCWHCCHRVYKKAVDM